MTRRALTAACVWGLLAAVVGRGQAGPAPTMSAVVYQCQERASPRPLRIHVIRVDLCQDGVALAVGVAPDPDEAGPAESQLRDPLTLIREHGMSAAGNANAFMVLTGPDGEPRIMNNPPTRIHGIPIPRSVPVMVGVTCR